MRNRKTRNFIVSVFLHALLLVSVYTVQGAIFPYLRIGGIVPLIIPLAVVGVALYEGRDTGAACGLFAGILCDVSFNQPIGVFTVLLTVVGTGIGILSDTVLLSGFASFYISSTIVLFVCAFVQMTPIIARGGDIPVGSIIQTTVLQTLYGLILAFPIWLSTRALGRRAESITPSGRMV